MMKNAFWLWFTGGQEDFSTCTDVWVVTHNILTAYSQQGVLYHLISSVSLIFLVVLILFFILLLIADDFWFKYELAH